MAKLDVNRALQLAESIENVPLKKLTLSVMVIQLTKIDVEGALRAAEGVQALTWMTEKTPDMRLARLHTDMEDGGMFTSTLGIPHIVARCESLCMFQKLRFDLGMTRPFAEVK